MEKKMSISDELQAIQSGEINCSPERLAICVTYCRKRLEAIRTALDSHSTPSEYRKQAEANAKKLSQFIRWAKVQSAEKTLK